MPVIIPITPTSSDVPTNDIPEAHIIGDHTAGRPHRQSGDFEPALIPIGDEPTTIPRRPITPIAPSSSILIIPLSPE